jgi:hypothetical protein
MGNAEGILGSDFLHQFNVGLDDREQLFFVNYAAIKRGQ